MIDVTSPAAIRLQLMLAAALKGVKLETECDVFHAPPDDGTKCMDCGLTSECHAD